MALMVMSITTLLEMQILSGKLNVRGAIQKFPKYINKNYYVLPGSYSAPSPSK
jgi:hypothetical protein